MVRRCACAVDFSAGSVYRARLRPVFSRQSGLGIPSGCSILGSSIGSFFGGPDGVRFGFWAAPGARSSSRPFPEHAGQISVRFTPPQYPLVLPLLDHDPDRAGVAARDGRGTGQPIATLARGIQLEASEMAR